MLAAWGTKELENETNAVTFAREVDSGGYQLVTTKELKGWIDEKKPMLIVDVNPEDSYKKQHIPRRGSHRVPQARHDEHRRPEKRCPDQIAGS